MDTLSGGGQEAGGREKQDVRVGQLKRASPFKYSSAGGEWDAVSLSPPPRASSLYFPPPPHAAL